MELHAAARIFSSEVIVIPQLPTRSVLAYKTSTVKHTAVLWYTGSHFDFCKPKVKGVIPDHWHQRKEPGAWNAGRGGGSPILPTTEYPPARASRLEGPTLCDSSGSAPTQAASAHHEVPLQPAHRGGWGPQLAAAAAGRLR